jgi:hypothetical protein
VSPSAYQRLSAIRRNARRALRCASAAPPNPVGRELTQVKDDCQRVDESGSSICRYLHPQMDN